jgi:DNA-binding transcriptional MerR regulator
MICLSIETVKNIFKIFCIAVCLSFCGCASYSQSDDLAIQRIRQMKIGMNTAEIKNLIGQPKSIVDVSITTEEKFQTWVYDDNQLRLNMEGVGNAMGHAFASGLGGSDNLQLALDFLNEKLIRIRGF